MTKLSLIFLFILIFNVSAFAENIRGLSQDQINDLNICLKHEKLSFERINRMENNAHMNWATPGDLALYHNFVMNTYDLYRFEETSFNNAILASGSFYISEKQDFENSIIANVTFAGDIDKLNFSNACLVNVRFAKASFIDILKIKFQARYTKNITD